MSTNDLNTNNASQTLFRFATMRNPELSDPKNIEKRFIFRDEQSQQNSAIDKAIKVTPSLQTLFQDPGKIPGFTLLTEEDLKTGYAPFYEYAVWVARNKATATRQEFDLKMKACKADHGIPVVDQKIWDNLVCQVVTRKEFYAKELLMQILHLHHILSVYDFTEESYQEVIKAKVVLPKELFRAPGSTGTSSGSQQASKTMHYDNKSMKMAEAGIELRQSRDLSASLKKMQEAYKKQYDTAYQQQYADYQEKTKPLQKQLQKETAAADNKKQILENRINYLTQLSVADPEKFYANSELDMEMHRIKDEILNIPSSEVEIPEFIFSFGPEIDATAIERALGTEDKSTLCRVFGVSDVPAALSGVSTFEEISRAVEQHSQLLQQKVLDNTVLNEETYANIGGVIVPVSNTSKAGSGSVIPFGIKTWLQPAAAGHTMLLKTDGSGSKHIVYGSYKLQSSNQHLLATGTTAEADVLPYVTNLFTGTEKIPLNSMEKYEVLIIEGEVTLNDGIVYTMYGRLDYTHDTMFKFEGEGTLTPKDRATDSGQGSGTSGPETLAYPGDMFIPSGFGMKNIGVADYLKVEQSLQGYVEGEVAHIENVMARERREKATKKTSKSEVTTMESSDTEKEQLQDTSSTDRFEMQSETNKAIQEIKDANATAFVNGENTYPSGSISYGVAGGFSTHNAKEESIREALTQAKEITQKATDRIVTKVHRERTEKMIEEFEETNIHEFDNRKGDKHVVGVYRWVDKVYKNQIYNYGKRMMFEFMIPEPARIHNLGMKFANKMDSDLVKPVDPRESVIHKLENFSSLADEVILKYWLGRFNVNVEACPDEYVYAGTGFDFFSQDANRGTSKTGSIKIPEGYVSKNASISFTGMNSVGAWDSRILVSIGNKSFIQAPMRNTDTSLYPLYNFSGEIPVTFAVTGYHTANVTVNVACYLTQETKNTWLQKTFNKIIEAYEKEKAKYEQDLAAIQAQGVQIKGSNPGFYRQIENTILRRNCISYMISQDPSAELTFGKDKYYTTNAAAESFLNTEVKLDAALDRYTAFAKFMEQAFEWEIMSYYLYPYYWGSRNNWNTMYQFDDNDPTFRAFMQSGMARVVVTVRPGFEEAVRHFTATGQIWNGGEVPVIDDPLFLSIVDEMRKTEGEKYGKAWPTRLPTALTILQAQSIGLTVTKALPFDEDLSDYEDASQVPQSSKIVISDAQMGGQETLKTGTLMGHIEGADGEDAKILMKHEDGSNYTFTFSDENGDWMIEKIPVGKYELIIDAYDVFPENHFVYVKGEKENEIIINDGETHEVNIVLKKI